MELNPAIPCSVSLSDLGHRFGKQEVLKGLQAKINAGEHVVIQGSNGSGKSTLGQIIAGHLTCSSGEILWKQQDSTRRKLGVTSRRHCVANDAHGTCEYIAPFAHHP